VLRPADLGFESTDDLEPLEGVHAQARALEAIRVASQIPAAGYNVFCVGLTGGDRMATVQAALAEVQCTGQPAPDRAYVMNFKQPEAPRLLQLPRGTARGLQRDFDDLVDQLVKHLGLVFEEDRFAGRIREITQKAARQERELLARLHDMAREHGFAVSEVESPQGTNVDLLFRLRGQALAMGDLERHADEARRGILAELTDSEADNRAISAELASLDLPRIQADYQRLSEQLRRSLVDARRIGRTMHRQISSIEREECLVVIDGAVEEMAARHSGIPAVTRHLDELRTDVLDHLALFKRGMGRGNVPPPEEVEIDESGVSDGGRDAFARYRVNVVHDNSNRESCPVVVESNPTARNVLGTITSIGDQGGRQLIDHRSIRPGSLLAADGGFLIVDAAEVLADADAWRQLKRVLLQLELDLRDAVSERGQPAGLVLRPEPIPISVKVIMVGDHATYDLMDDMDQDFRHVFKIRAEFDWLMDRSAENVRRLGSYIKRLQKAEGLLPFGADAVALLAEHGARLAEQPGRMISRFDVLAEPARQANLHATRARARTVQGSHVRAALGAAARRCSLAAERIHAAIHEKRIIINTSGSLIGQVNGLGVVSTIEHAFGHPMRITAVVGKGDEGIVNIEREVRLSGSLHDKGMFIVEGYLTHAYGKQVPLAFSASLAFEQLYGGIEGDSASAAEIFALLSALAEIPIDQAIAVTGSVNQVGEIQPVGGVNEKIEGFFDACVGIAKGAEKLSGRQGVMIPRANVGDLMLREDVVAAAREGRFHVWSIDHVEAGLELLMGVPAGLPDRRGRYPDGTIHARVLEGLKRLAPATGLARLKSPARRAPAVAEPGRSPRRPHGR
jgi:predicted ATP-dependent protease